MRWLDKLERHFGFMALPNLILITIVGQILVTVATLKDPTVPLQLMLDPAAVAAGQWWRIVTWIFVPAAHPLGVFQALFYFQFLLIVARSLESEWGAFKSTLYVLLGAGLPTLGAMLLWQFLGVQVLLSGWHYTATLLLAIAVIAPDLTILLMFILPVKMRWLAWGLGALLIWNAQHLGWLGLTQLFLGVGNYLIFFIPTGIQAWRLQQLSLEGKKVFREAKREADRTVARTCAVCGRGVEADLRLCHCERCGEDGLNYCPEHLTLHLAVPEKIGSPAPVKKKRKS
jgi:hypothetical protein